ncbi:cytochrome P450 [Glomus cerebriforme]|uniref:Cytochrome P450 n=1 Tax=Glomus cerebriforme TaxID=658196 RepID=A0A397TGE4_9GLOM|nr:cytochrome P450 [Glomus cerebriforme]
MPISFLILFEEKQYIILLLVVGYIIHYYILKNNKFNKDDYHNFLIPRIVPYKIPWIGSAIPYGTNPTKFLSECREKYGNIFTLKLAGKNITFLLDPLVLPLIFKEKNFVFSSFADKIVQQAFSIDKSTTARMSHQARNPQKYLGGENLLKLIENTKIKLVDTILNKIKSNDNFDNKPEWKQGYFYDFIARILWISSTEGFFGKGFAEEDMWNDFYTFDNKFPILISGIPKIFAWSALKSQKKLCQLFTKQRLFRENENEWVTYRSKEFLKIFDQEQFMNIQFSLIWALMANTIPIAFWTIANIISNSHIKMRCEQEIENFTKVDPKTKQINFIELSKFIYIDACINEALRLTSSSLVVREALEDSKIHVEYLNQTYLIKKGETIAFYPPLTHIDSEIYGDDAKEYNPSRFLPNKDGSKKIFMKNGKEVKLHLVPFGGGSSMCPGRHYAREEIKLLVIYCIYYIDFKLHDKIPSIDIKRAGLGVYSPLNDIKFEYRLKYHIQVD